MQDGEITVQGAVIVRWVNDDPVDVVYNTTAVGEGGADTDTPSVHLVTPIKEITRLFSERTRMVSKLEDEVYVHCAVCSSKNSPVVKDGTATSLEVGVEVHRVQESGNRGVLVDGSHRSTHNPLGICWDS